MRMLKTFEIMALNKCDLKRFKIGNWTSFLCIWGVASKLGEIVAVLVPTYMRP